jgi:hypothetical protein
MLATELRAGNTAIGKNISYGVYNLMGRQKYYIY